MAEYYSVVIFRQMTSYTRQLKQKIYTTRRLEMSLVVGLISILSRHPDVYERRVKLWCLFDFLNSTLEQLRVICVNYYFRYYQPCLGKIFRTVPTHWLELKRINLVGM